MALPAASMLSTPLPPISPPPPPPPPPQKAKDTRSRSGSGKMEARVQLSAEEEIRQTVERLPSWRFSSSGDGEAKWLACNQPIRHISQEGPTCGLVALCMAASLCGTPTKDPDTVLTSARKRGYTLQGEMFSAATTLKFAEEEFGLQGRLLSGGLSACVADVITHLARGLPVLLPYDRDSNNEPTCRNGHSAHWAVLTGFLIMMPPGASISLPCCRDDAADRLLSCSPPWTEEALASVPCLIRQAEQLYVFARQGKSRLLGAWLYSSLATSNQNLREYDPTLEGDYVYHADGLAAGLGGKVIFLCNNDRN